MFTATFTIQVDYSYFLSSETLLPEGKFKLKINSQDAVLYTGKFHPNFIFALWLYDKFKTGLIELYKDYVTKLESGQIEDWAIKFQISIGQKWDWVNSKLYIWSI